jgi:hypothetical protein
MEQRRDAYERKVKLFSQDLIKKCKDILINRWNSIDEILENAEPFGHAYLITYSDYLHASEEMERSLIDAGYHLTYAIRVFIRRKATLDDVLEFTEQMISEQVFHLAEWCN